ncbi:DUF1642 domain-containing protein [Companilactobacillus baiquanensis]|uniref:DUF1642 domain-containing protein n=1 Tax=Companilactobacillus baiquanensis TaxID=2486005 RepID=A0ABW1UYE3_9LACO|nr:DUF1642 domain-containing protein [Companilactobacillus baiquanensis]
MRVLKGYSKNQQKELEYARKNISCNDFLHNITYFTAYAECDSIKDKYDKANTDERISIIRDILDFYTDKAKFPDPKKYYVQLIKNNDGSYLNRSKLNNSYMTNSCQSDDVFQTEFTEQEIKDIDPRYMAFAVPVEDDDE